MTIQYQGVWSLQSAAQLQSTQRWVTDPLYRNTTLLLQADDAANAAQNNTFLDSSSNSFAITRNGNTTQGSFTPFSQSPGWWGNFFSGTTDNLSFASNAAFGVGTGNFTVEFFLNLTAWSGNQRYFLIGANGTDGISIGRLTATNDLLVDIANTRIITYAWAPIINRWYHIVLVRSGTGSNQTVLYIDGISVATGTSSGSVGQNAAYIGGLTWASSYNAQGYISNMRFSNVARTIVVPTEPYSSDANTVILSCQSNRFIDNSGTPKTITVNGTPSVQPFSPFAPQYQWTSSVIGGSGYFDGTSDYLTATYSTTNFDWFTSGQDFTLEAWVYPTTLTGWSYNAGAGDFPTLIGNATPTSSTNNWSFGPITGGTVRFFYFNGAVVTVTSTATCRVNQWNHIAFTKTSSGITIYVNGVGTTATAISGTPQSSAGVNLTIGSVNSTAINGYVSSLRILKNVTPPYSGTSYTIPTAPLTAISGTNFLLNFTNAAIFDGTMKNNLETAGNAQISTAVVKYGSGSMYFDGTSDYLVIPKRPYFDFPGDFTIEFWLYVNSLASYSFLMDTRSSISTFWLIDLTTAGVIGWGPDATIRISSSAITTGQWYHVAISRLGASTRMFLNGTQTGSTYTSSASITAGTTSLVIAGSAVNLGTSNANVYMDDIRISTGIARYTANFIPPSVALPRQ